MDRNEAWQRVVELERQLAEINERRSAIIGEIAINLAIVKGETQNVPQVS